MLWNFFLGFFKCLSQSDTLYTNATKTSGYKQYLLQKREKCSHFIFPTLPCGTLLKGIWLFLSLHSPFLMDDLPYVYFEHFKLVKVNCCELPTTYSSTTRVKQLCFTASPSEYCQTLEYGAELVEKNR